MRGSVETSGIPINESTQSFDSGLHGHQHALHIWMIDDWRRFTCRRSGCTSLTSYDCVIERLLIRTFCNRQTFKTHANASLVHHGEHVRHAVIFFTDEIPDCTAIITKRQHTCGACLDAELVLDGNTIDIVAFAE